MKQRLYSVVSIISIFLILSMVLGFVPQFYTPAYAIDDIIEEVDKVEAVDDPNGITPRGPGSVTIQRTGANYPSLWTAMMDGAEDNDVLVVTGTLTEHTSVFITKDVTIIAGDGGGTINTGISYIECGSGKKLTLGSGDLNDPLLDLNMGVRVINGEILIQDGVDITRMVSLIGHDATGSISGGKIVTDYIALWLERGAILTEISGGVFYGEESALHMSDKGTEIKTISGGTFSHNASGRYCVYVQNNSKIGVISGGAFTSSTNSVLCIIRGGWVDEITGDAFVETKYKSGTNKAHGIGVVTIEGGTYWTSGIGKISGGSFAGEIGIWLYGSNGQETAIINEITGGEFKGSWSGIQTERYTKIEEISGGIFEGDLYGIHNIGAIGTISESAKFLGFYGLYNNGTYGVGTVKKIEGGEFIGSVTAFFSTGDLDKISGGVFWGKGGDAICLATPVFLEPHLTTEAQGMGRYLSGSGNIFNDEGLVTYPAGYFMSSLKEEVNGRGESFHYLTKTITIRYDSNNGTGSMDNGIGEYNESVTLAKNQFTREDYIFTGWNTAADGQGMSYGEGEPYQLTDDLVLYAQWTKQGNNNNSGESSNNMPNKGKEEIIIDPEIPLGLLKDDHIAYIQGYPEGDFRPENPITRAEAAQIFYNLLIGVNKTGYSSNFPDVKSGIWYSDAINCLNANNIILGYPDGSFKPNEYITRAEFATLASKFDELSLTGKNQFKDVNSNHWAIKYINSAAVKGWIKGYENGEFRPDNNITRAETVTLINSILERKISLEDIPEEARTYIDITPSHWAYCDIIEASNSHAYERKEDGLSEIWTKVID